MTRFRLLELYWLVGGKKFYQACSKVHEFAEQIIERSLSLDSESGPEKKYDFLRSVDKSMQGDRELGEVRLFISLSLGEIPRLVFFRGPCKSLLYVADELLAVIE